MIWNLTDALVLYRDLVKQFHGIDLATWRAPEDIADAIDSAVNGKAQQHISSLRRLAVRITAEFGAEQESD